jgi:hypothetical protein
MNLLDIIEVEPEEYLTRDFSYPVFVHLKGANLYTHRETGVYNREDFTNILNVIPAFSNLILNTRIS